ncbi:MAG: hypothetical protein Q7K54_03120 [Candidatus Parcubacteria bacterium]|nr:hypothetical protein [Candidatus Parcubacteria bacterium]
MNKKTYEELFALAVEGVLSDQADDVGIYPRAIVSPDGVEKQRTEYQSGWNDASIAILKQKTSLSRFYEELTDTQKKQLGELLLLDAGVWLQGDKEKICLYLNMNDTFAWACADAEEFTIEELPIIYDVFEKFGHSGIIAWASQKNGMEPIKPCCTDDYRAAKVYLKLEQSK